jgi:hypothetical protein
MPARKVDDSPVFQLKVTLKGSKPPIWRRILVRGSTTLPRLHRCLQIVMDWADYHLHLFVVRDAYRGEITYGEPDPEYGDDGTRNEKRIRLDRIVAEPKDRFVYEYDFGDGWEHNIVVEKVLPPDPKARYPVCLTGKRASPPEDVGGIWGYYEFLEAIADPAHPEHQEKLDWIGGSFDPEEFDLETTNALLKAL